MFSIFNVALFYQLQGDPKHFNIGLPQYKYRIMQ